MGEPTAEADLAPSRRYLDALREGQLIYQRCDGCRAAVFPPRVLCPVCSADTLAWQPSTGRGTVYSASTLMQRDEDPYTVVLVDLDDGFRVMSAMAEAAPIGARVHLVARPADDPAGDPRLLALLDRAPDA